MKRLFFVFVLSFFAIRFLGAQEKIDSAEYKIENMKQGQNGLFLSIIPTDLSAPSELCRVSSEEVKVLLMYFHESSLEKVFGKTFRAKKYREVSDAFEKFLLYVSKNK